MLLLLCLVLLGPQSISLVGYAWEVSPDGTTESTHETLTEISAEIVRLGDSKRLYEEIYSLEHVSALQYGSTHEDDGTRAFNHYYDGTNGLGWVFYYAFWEALLGTPVSEPASGRYLSALDWARDGGGGKDQLNWKGAIEVYDYTPQSKIEAYQRLGHVLHLLQDVAEPDHARLVDHPVSSEAGREGLRDGVLIDPKTGSRRSGVELWKIGRELDIDVDRLSASRIGFEELITPRSTGGHYDFSKLEQESNFDGSIYEKGIFEEYFDRMVEDSKKAYRSRFGDDRNAVGIESAAVENTGLRWLAGQLSPPIDASQFPDTGTTPLAIYANIDVSNAGRFLALADELLPKAVGRGAALLQFFHDIVNPPPYVKEVEIKQEGVTRYKWFWKDTEVGGSAENRQFLPEKIKIEKGVKTETTAAVDAFLIFDKNKPLDIIITFGPEGKRIKDSSVKVELDEIEVDGKLDHSGSFDRWTARLERPPEIDPNKPLLERYVFPLSIEAKDKNLHYNSTTRKTVDGADLDSDPSLPAKVTYSGGKYSWGDTYKPGPDTNHKIRVLDVPLDLVFVIDVTGSMGVSIQTVKDQASRLVDKIAAASSDWRIGIVTFRDFGITKEDIEEGYGEEGDRPYYVNLEFSQNEINVLDAIKAIQVSGGADIPEAWTHTLMWTLGHYKWRNNVRKVMILMGDAPAHTDYKNRENYDNDEVARKARAIDPVVIYSVLTEYSADPDFLDETRASFKEIAELTGGKLISVTDVEKLPDEIMGAIESAIVSPEPGTPPPAPPPNPLLYADSLLRIGVSVVAIVAVVFVIRRIRKRKAAPATGYPERHPPPPPYPKTPTTPRSPPPPTAYTTPPPPPTPYPAQSIPPPPPPPEAAVPRPPFCANCGRPTTYVQQYQRYYCYYCQKYA